MLFFPLPEGFVKCLKNKKKQQSGKLFFRQSDMETKRISFFSLFCTGSASEMGEIWLLNNHHVRRDDVAGEEKKCACFHATKRIFFFFDRRWQNTLSLMRKILQEFFFPSPRNSRNASVNLLRNVSHFVGLKNKVKMWAVDVVKRDLWENLFGGLFEEVKGDFDGEKNSLAIFVALNFRTYWKILDDFHSYSYEPVIFHFQLHPSFFITRFPPDNLNFNPLESLRPFLSLP